MRIPPLAFTLSALSFGVLLQDPVPIAPALAAGETVTRRIERDVRWTTAETRWFDGLEAPDDTERKEKGGAALSEFLRCEDEVLDVTDGSASRFERRWKSYRRGQGKEVASEREAVKISKKPLVFSRQGANLGFVDRKGRPPEKDEPLQGAVGDLDLALALRAGSIEVGVSWTADVAPLLTLLAPGPYGQVGRERENLAELLPLATEESRQLRLTLEGVREEDGRRVADVALAAKGAVEGEWNIGMALGSRDSGLIRTQSRVVQSHHVTGRVVWDIDRGRVIELEATNRFLTGRLSATGSRERGDDEQVGTREGDRLKKTAATGTATIHVRNAWDA
ncbi:MAG: hypothetical protein AAF726_09385 [Planctomycetota bacterium]